MSMKCEPSAISPTPGAEPEQRSDDRQAHRDERAEGDEQHDDRRDQADGGGEAEARLLRLLDRLAAELHLQPATTAGLRRRDDPLHVDFGRSLARLSKVTVANAMRPSREIAVLPPARVGADCTPVTCGSFADSREHRLCARTHGCFAHLPVRRVQDDLVDVAGLRRKVALEQVGRSLRVGAGQREVAGVTRAHGPREDDGDREGAKPAEQHRSGGGKSRIAPPAPAGWCAGERRSGRS